MKPYCEIKTRLDIPLRRLFYRAPWGFFSISNVFPYLGFHGRDWFLSENETKRYQKARKKAGCQEIDYQPFWDTKKNKRSADGFRQNDKCHSN